MHHVIWPVRRAGTETPCPAHLPLPPGVRPTPPAAGHRLPPVYHGNATQRVEPHNATLLTFNWAPFSEDLQALLGAW